MPSLEFDVDGTAVRVKLKRSGIIGREAECDYQIEHGTVSRKHAEVHLNFGEVVIVDLGSANGTRVNGEKILGPRALKDNDQVELGRVRGLFRQAVQQVTQEPTVDNLRSEIAAASANAQEKLLEKLFDLVDTGDIYQALSEATKQLKQAMAMFDCVLVFDQMDGRVLLGEPEDSKRPAGLLRQAVLLAEGKPRHFNASERELLAREHQIIPRDLMFVFELGRARDVQLAFYVDGAMSLSEGTAQSLALACRVLKLIVKRFDRSQVAQVSDEDLKLAQRVQRRLLKNEAPKIPGFKSSVSYLPALAVGGDFYDFGLSKAGELVIVIGDVSGKGVSASLYMAHIMGGLREFIPIAKGPSELIEQMNRWLLEVLEPGLFATMAACFVDSKKSVARFAQAGHAPPVLRSAARKVIDLGSDPGAPLGASDDMKPKEVKLALSSGDILLFTTDGVEEGENARGEAFGNDRRDASIKRVSGALACTLAVREALLEFVQSTTSSDDMTIIALERE
jgi:serine phosphatase RsbU (regulator of sigma subunit)